MRAVVHLKNEKEAEKYGIKLTQDVKKEQVKVVQAGRVRLRATREIRRLKHQAVSVKLQSRRLKIESEIADARARKATAEAKEYEAKARLQEAKAKVWKGRKHRVNAVLNFMFGEPKRGRRR